jgi:hypothetical protein
VRLVFAEPESLHEGERIFDVKLQGQPVVDVRLRVGSEPRQVLLARKTVKPLYDEAAQTILLSSPHE